MYLGAHEEVRERVYLGACSRAPVICYDTSSLLNPVVYSWVGGDTLQFPELVYLYCNCNLRVFQ